MFFLTGAGGSPTGRYQIDRSLRFNDDDSAYLSRTPGSAGNRKTWTWSGWVKKCKNGAAGDIFACYFANNDNSNLEFRFDSSDRLNVTLWSGSTITNAVYRDPSAWYHLVLAIDTTSASAKCRLWVNGVEVTSFSADYVETVGLNADLAVNSANAHRIGRWQDADGGAYFFDGYLAEIHFVDGTALDPTSFGEFDTNGVWRPIKVSGLTYGTNGFYLSFADNTSTTTLGYDDAGSNDWTLNNFSVAAGAGNDSLEDTPTNNYCTFNPLVAPIISTMSNGNMVFGRNYNASYPRSTGARGTHYVSSGKWYFELEFTNVGSNNGTSGTADDVFGVISSAAPNDVGTDFVLVSTAWIYQGNGNKGNGSTSAYGSSLAEGDVVGVAVDMDVGHIWFAKNGTWQASGDPAAGTNAAFTNLAGSFVTPLVGAYHNNLGGTRTRTLNAGQRPFAYTPPTGFSALCTANLPTPDIADPGSYMNAVTYTGTGSSLAVTGVGFQPDLVWIKGRSGATDHALYDSTRGVEKQLESNTTTDETTEATGLTAFGSDGFTVGALAQVNTNTATYVGWCWREGVTPGFDIVTYTGTGVARTISHNLGTTPKLIIVKARSTASTDQGWPVYHASNTTAPETDYLLLNSTAATADLDTVWNDTAPTTTVFSVGTNALVNALNDTYVAYLFAEVEGFSKFGSYTGNGSADGPFVWCGFRPRYLLIKNSGAAATNWRIFDAARNTINVMNFTSAPDDPAAEVSTLNIDFLSNGFKLRTNTGSSLNATSNTYIFAAFAEQPFSAPANAR